MGGPVDPDALPAFADALIGLSPKFRAWYASQAQGMQTAIAALWTTAAADPSVAIEHRNADYARKAIFIASVASTHGYQP